MIRPYITRHDTEIIMNCVMENPNFDETQIQRATRHNTLVIKEVLRQAREQGIIE